MNNINKSVIAILIIAVVGIAAVCSAFSNAPKEYVYSEDLTYGQIYDASSSQSNAMPSEAFDNNIWADSSWAASNAENNQWISVEFDEPKHIGQLNLEFGRSPGNARNFKLQGYFNGDWIDVYTGICEDSLSRWHKFEFENKKDYTQYRVLVLDTYPVGSTSTISIAEIEMIEIDTQYDVFGKIWTLDGKIE